jgi:CheY-like chemotaxis protein
MILVVEDDQDIRETICDVLESEGYQVVAATNGREALHRLHAMELPCLILLDLMMPVMTGGELLAELRRTDRLAELPVAVVSAWPREAAQVSSQTQAYVRKPVALSKLLEVVERYCRVS